jgi:hypothetical protein
MPQRRSSNASPSASELICDRAWTFASLIPTESGRLVAVYMELAGLEPATSWVRFKSTTTPNPHHERVSGQPSRAEPPGYPALPRRFWGWDARHPQNDRPLPGGRNRAARVPRVRLVLPRRRPAAFRVALRADQGRTARAASSQWGARNARLALQTSLLRGPSPAGSASHVKIHVRYMSPCPRIGATSLSSSPAAPRSCVGGDSALDPRASSSASRSIRYSMPPPPCWFEPTPTRCESGASLRSPPGG